MSRAEGRAAAAEAEIRELARLAKEGLSKMESRSLLIEAALRVIMKHGLLNEFSQEMNHPPAAASVPNGEQGGAA